MPNVQNTQGAAPKAPPIPAMDVSPPPSAPPGREVAQAVRDIARQARIAAQDAKNAAQNPPIPAHTATTAPPFAYDANNIIPPQVVDISLAFFLTVAVCVVGYPLARALGRRIDRKTELKSAQGPDLTPHIRQLQDSVDAMAIEIERISEGQRFAAKLLAGHSAATLEQK